MSNLSIKENMVQVGWRIWDDIIHTACEMERTAYFVVVEDTDIPQDMVYYLIRNYVKVREVRTICIISNIYDENELIDLGKKLRKVYLTEYEIDCLLNYYSIIQFEEYFYVLSFNKFDRYVPAQLREKLSNYEMAATGILNLRMEELEECYG